MRVWLEASWGLDGRLPFPCTAQGRGCCEVGNLQWDSSMRLGLHKPFLDLSVLLHLPVFEGSKDMLLMG